MDAITSLTGLPLGLIEGLGCTLAISSAPTLLLYFIPINVLYEPVFGLDVLKVLLSFASGGILGDVLIHAIPHLLNPHSHDDHDHGHDHHDHHNHDHDHGDHDHDHKEAAMHAEAVAEVAMDPHMRGVLVSILIIIGFTFFLVADRVVSRLQRQAHDQEQAAAVGAGKKTDSDSVASIAVASAGAEEKKGEEEAREGRPSRRRAPARGTSRGRGESSSSSSRSSSSKSGKGGRSNSRGRVKTDAVVLLAPVSSPAHCHGHTHGHTATSIWELTPTGLLNIVADTIHNFTDGIMVGAVFAGGNSDLKWSTFLAVLLHEVPHELADFAILIQSGFSKTAAIKAQFCTAVAAFVGTAVGFYLAHSYQEAEDVLVAVVSGGFLYLATANILPLTAAETPNPNGVAMAPWTQMALDLLAFCTGIALMVVVAFLEILSHEHAHAH